MVAPQFSMKRLAIVHNSPKIEHKYYYCLGKKAEKAELLVAGGPAVTVVTRHQVRCWEKLIIPPDYGGLRS